MRLDVTILSIPDAVGPFRHLGGSATDRSHPLCATTCVWGTDVAVLLMSRAPLERVPWRGAGRVGGS